MQENYNVGIYCRLSRDDERAGESVSIENQREMLGRYVHEQGWNLYATYCDDGVSGTTFDRPGFNQLIADATAGKINLVLCKDLSRLGRDYIEAGKYTDMVFPSLGCRFIALNDGVDTIHKNNEMLIILKNVMNDLYARDTSNKIRAVKQSTFKTGKYVGCYAPIGYRKSPEDKHVLVIDPETAPVVKRIFDLRCQGYSYRKIALTLNGENVPTPSSFYYMKQGKPNIRQDGDFWAGQTVKSILRNEVYLGHMVQNKTGNVSYKVHKQIPKPEEEWIRVENTHEPLITQETWDIVREMDAQNVKYRSDKSGNTALFSGLLVCADCGSLMRHYHDGRIKKDGTQSTYQSYACGRYVSGGKTVCSAHIMNQRVLVELVLLDIRYKATLAQNCPDALREKILKQKNAANLERTKTIRATLTALDKRLAELDKLVVATYEDKVKGAMPEELCIQLMNRYEAERKDKLEQRTQLTAQLETFQEDEQSADEWLGLIRNYAQLQELDRPTLLRLVKRIEVGEKYELDGEIHRDIKIYYNFVGYVEF
jgi:DNA invertase Pin-like site-specific DNA recombinase